MASLETQLCTYHIFLSFRGKDTRLNFTDHLYTSLLNAGFHTFRDDDEIERGVRIDSELQRAINESRISIIVFSKDYASSRWCLDELVKILDRRKDGHKVLPIFYDVEPSQVGNQRDCFAEAFAKHEERGKLESEWKKKVEVWREALKEVSKLGGKVLQDEANGHEAVFIQKIVKEVGKILKRTVLSVAPYTVGVESRVRDIDSWLKDESPDVGIAVLCGMRGIGKTTIAKVAYNLNFENFEASSFLANIRETSDQQYGLVRLQTQLLSDISKGKKQKIYNVDEGIIKIQDAICSKRILVVLDDVDRVEQLDAVMGTLTSLCKGSKIIITTWRERLLKGREVHKTFKIEELNDRESFQLFCRYAFAQDRPPEGYLENSERVIRHCEGLPLALEVLGSSLFGRSLEFWESALEKLEAIPDERIRKTLEVSYKSLQDDHDKRLFLNIVSSFVGKDKDYAAKLLEESNFYSTVGIQNLVDRSLITIDKDNKLTMHQLVRDMGRAIIRQESPNCSYNSLREKTDTQTIEGSLGKDKFTGNRAKRHRSEDLQDESMPPYDGNSLKRRFLGFLSSFPLTAGLPKLFSEQRKQS